MTATAPKTEVLNVDCLDFMRSLPDNAFDLAIADPPYGGGNAVDGEWTRFNGSGRQAKYKNSPPNTTASAVASTATRRRGGAIKALRLRPSEERQGLPEPEELGRRNSEKNC